MAQLLESLQKNDDETNEVFFLENKKKSCVLRRCRFSQNLDWFSLRSKNKRRNWGELVKNAKITKNWVEFSRKIKKGFPFATLSDGDPKWRTGHLGIPLLYCGPSLSLLCSVFLLLFYISCISNGAKPSQFTSIIRFLFGFIEVSIACCTLNSLRELIFLDDPTYLGVFLFFFFFFFFFFIFCSSSSFSLFFFRSVREPRSFLFSYSSSSSHFARVVFFMFSDIPVLFALSTRFFFFFYLLICHVAGPSRGTGRTAVRFSREDERNS